MVNKWYKKDNKAIKDPKWTTYDLPYSDENDRA